MPWGQCANRCRSAGGPPSAQIARTSSLSQAAAGSQTGGRCSAVRQGEARSAEPWRPSLRENPMTRRMSFDRRSRLESRLQAAYREWQRPPLRPPQHPPGLSGLFSNSCENSDHDIPTPIRAQVATYDKKIPLRLRPAYEYSRWGGTSRTPWVLHSAPTVPPLRRTRTANRSRRSANSPAGMAHAALCVPTGRRARVLLALFRQQAHQAEGLIDGRPREHHHASHRQWRCRAPATSFPGCNS